MNGGIFGLNKKKFKLKKMKREKNIKEGFLEEILRFDIFLFIEL